MDKTVRTRAFSDDGKSPAPQSNLTEAQEKALELVNKNAQLEEMKGKVLDHLKTIEQLRENLKQEQAKSATLAKRVAELEAKIKDSAGQDVTILEAKSKEVASLEAKLKELTEMLDKISGIAATRKAS